MKADIKYSEHNLERSFFWGWAFLKSFLQRSRQCLKPPLPPGWSHLTLPRHVFGGIRPKGSMGLLERWEVHRVWEARESNCCKWWKFANINLCCTASGWEPCLVHMWKTTMSPALSSATAFYQNLPLHVKNQSSQTPVKGCPVSIIWGVWRTLVECISSQGHSTRLNHPLLLYFVSLIISGVPSRCSWTQQGRSSSLTQTRMHSRQEKGCSFLPKPCHATCRYREAAWDRSSSGPACSKTAVFPTGLRIQLVFLHPKKSLMLPYSCLLALAGEGVSVESEGKPLVPVWALGIWSYMPGQKNHKAVSNLILHPGEGHHTTVWAGRDL